MNYNGSGSDEITMDTSGNITFAGNVDVGGAGGSAVRFTARGSGTGTTSYSIEGCDSNGVSKFLVRDDGAVLIGGLLCSMTDAGGDFQFTNANSNGGYEFFVRNSSGTYIQSLTLVGAGDVLFGKTSVTTTGAGSYFETTGIGYGRVNFTSTVTTGYPAVFYHDDGGGSPSAVGSISNSSSATSFNTSSDYRLKEDLKDFNGLDKISKIKTYDFKWKNDNSRSYGVLAHELQEIIPQAVTGEKDGMTIQKETNEEGEVIDKEVINPQNVDYSKIVPVLLKSIQEQQEIIEDLKKRIETLEK
jgi:hypothetical protein